MCHLHFLPPTTAYSMGQWVSQLQPLANLTVSDNIHLFRKEHIHKLVSLSARYYCSPKMFHFQSICFVDQWEPTDSQQYSLKKTMTQQNQHWQNQEANGHCHSYCLCQWLFSKCFFHITSLGPALLMFDLIVPMQYLHLFYPVRDSIVNNVVVILGRTPWIVAHTQYSFFSATHKTLTWRSLYFLQAVAPGFKNCLAVVRRYKSEIFEKVQHLAAIHGSFKILCLDREKVVHRLQYNILWNVSFLSQNCF